jgi:quaternary ammonium compound-resistance protein SugE
MRRRRPAPPVVLTDALPAVTNLESSFAMVPRIARERAQDVAIAWAYLIAAGLCEIGWLIGLKWTQEPGWTVLGTAMAVVSLAISGGLLFLAQRDISLGTSYAVWTGIGAAGTFLVGVWFFGDPSSLGRWLGASLIIAGVVTLKLAH